MSVPLHWSADGLPVGVHSAGRYGEEATLLALAVCRVTPACYGGHPRRGPFTPECRDHFRREPVQLFQCHGEPVPSAMLQTTRSKPG